MTIAELGVGGAERVTLQLAEGMAARGHEVTLAAARGPLDAEAEALDVERVVLPVASGGKTAVLRNALALRKALRRSSPDVIHAHNIRASATVQLVSGDTRLITTFHAVPREREQQALKVLRRSDVVVCVSFTLAKQLTELGLEGVEVIRNAIDVPQPLGAGRRAELKAELGVGNGPVVAIIGRLAPQKNHSRFLAAAARVGERDSSVRFLIVGGGELEQAIAKQIDDLDLSDRVVMTGARNDARDIAATASVVVFSSDWEGLSIAALEALAAAVPVVSTDVAGMRELLGSGAGMVVPHDSDALAQAVSSLLEDEPRREAQGQLGQRLVRTEYSLQRLLDGYERVYAV